MNELRVVGAANIVAVCYLCNAAEGEELRCECACLGTGNGYVHYLCLKASATAANASWVEGDGIDSFISPWKVCGLCHNNYGSRFAMTMAVHFVLSVQENFRPGTDNWKQIESKYYMMSVQLSLQHRMSDWQKDNVIQNANLIMCLIKHEGGPRLTLTSRRWKSIVSNCFQARGVIMLMCGGPESVNNALHEFSMQCSMAASNNDQTGVMRAHRLIEYLEDDFHEGDDLEDYAFQLTLVD